MAIFTTLSVVIWFYTGTLGIFATLVYVFTMHVVIYDILSMAIITTLSTSQCGENRHTDIANFAALIHTKKINTLYGGFYYTVW